MSDFLEERFFDDILTGSSWQDDYSVQVVRTAGGQEYRSLAHPFPLRKFDVSYLLDQADTAARLLALWHRAHGQYAGFRARCFDEWSSNGMTGTPTATDQLTKKISSTVWQLRKWYGTDGAAGAAGYPYRTIYKPVSGSVMVAVNGTPVVGPGANWTVDTTTGRITLSAGVAATVVGDNVRAGFEFDFMVRFGSALVIGQDYPNHRSIDGVILQEIIAP
jgi:uncharacterized protein (TIGR02217 family)